MTETEVVTLLLDRKWSEKLDEAAATNGFSRDEFILRAVAYAIDRATVSIAEVFAQSDPATLPKLLRGLLRGSSVADLLPDSTDPETVVLLGAALKRANELGVAHHGESAWDEELTAELDRLAKEKKR